jgi:folate-binding protein YgfZ
MPDPFAAPIRRDVVTATGPDTITFLQGQMSQDLAALAVGASAWSLLLQPQGKVDAWVRVTRSSDEEVRIDVDAGWGQAIVARLERFKLRTRCDITLQADIAGVAVRATTVEGGLGCGWPDMEGVDVLGTDVGDVSLGDDVLLYDGEAYEAERIRCGVPRMGAEITPDTIPAELGDWLVQSSVSFTKGCFTGQELVARIDSRGGNVPRRLRVFTSQDLPPVPGTEVLADDKMVGVVTSSAIGAWGDAVGLAFIRRSATPPFDATAADMAVHFPESRPEP